MSDRVTAWIQDRRNRHQAATDGPWDKRGSLAWEGSQFGASGVSLGQTWGVRWGEDQVAIVDAHNEFPKALTVLEKVLGLHVPKTKYGPDYYSGGYPCVECNLSDQEGLDPTLWPCLTVRAIESALEAGE